MEEFFDKLEKMLEKKADRQQVIVRGGIGPLGLLGIAFIVMKIVGTISWSWWLVLAPFWIPVAIALVFVTLMLVLFSIIVVKYKPTEKIDGNYTTTSTADVTQEQINTPVEKPSETVETTTNVVIENPVSEVKVKKTKKPRRKKNYEQATDSPKQGDANTTVTEDMQDSNSEC